MKTKFIFAVALSFTYFIGSSQNIDTVKYKNIEGVGVTAKSLKKTKQEEIDKLYTVEFVEEQMVQYVNRHNYLSDRLEEFDRMLKGSSKSKLILSSTGDYKPSIYTTYYESSSGTKKFCEDVNKEISNISNSNNLQASDRAKYISSLIKMKDNLSTKAGKVNSTMVRKLKV